MFTSIPLYAVFITHFAINWGFAIILTLLPTYFEKILHLNIKNVNQLKFNKTLIKS